MKYKTGKILHPMMNMAVAFFNEKEIEDISAYYQSLGKPAFTSSLIKIKGDDDVTPPPARTLCLRSAAPYARCQVIDRHGPDTAEPGKGLRPDPAQHPARLERLAILLLVISSAGGEAGLN
jgi:hypothetical protein